MLSDSEIVVFPDEEFAEFHNLYGVVKEWLHILLIGSVLEAIPTMNGTGCLPTGEEWGVADKDAVGLCAGLYPAVPVGAVVGLEHLLRSLDDEMVRSVIEVEKDCRGVLLFLNGVVVGLVGIRHFVFADIVATGDFKSGLSRGIGGNILPPLSVSLVKPSMHIAIKVAHLVKNSIAEVIDRCVIIGTYLDADTPAPSLIELPECTASVGNGHFDGGELVLENLTVELVEPSLHIFDCRYHISFPF